MYHFLVNHLNILQNWNLIYFNFGSKLQKLENAPIALLKSRLFSIKKDAKRIYLF